MNIYDTKRWLVNQGVDRSDTTLREPAQLLQQNEVIAFPTETVYGLGGNAFSSEAVGRIFSAKGRPSDNPLIVHISSLDQMEQVVSHVPAKARKLMELFWPGPLTLVMPATADLPFQVTAGLHTVGVRMPDHPIALELIRLAGVPLAAPSANLSGRPSPTTADHVWEDLHGRIAGIVDGGPTGVGIESTVLDVTADIPIILRPGGISKEQLEQVLGKVEWDESLLNSKEVPRSPGMKYRHYAPRGELWLAEADTPRGMVELINHKLVEWRSADKRIGVLTTAENSEQYPAADVILTCGRRDDLLSVAHNLYDVLREFDRLQVDVIISETFEEAGVGSAVMNRLRKAAGGRTIVAVKD